MKLQPTKLRVTQSNEFKQGDRLTFELCGDLTLHRLPPDCGGWIPNDDVKHLNKSTKVVIDYDSYYERIRQHEESIAELKQAIQHFKETVGGEELYLHDMLLRLNQIYQQEKQQGEQK